MWTGNGGRWKRRQCNNIRVEKEQEDKITETGNRTKVS